MNHVIKKQVLDIVTRSPEGAFELQQQVSNFFYSTLFPAIEKSFDEFSSQETIHYIDKLEIDLGAITLKDLKKQDLAKWVMQKLERELRSGILPEIRKQPENSPGVSISRQWLFYMKHGYLNWNTTQTDDRWLTLALEGFASDSAAVEELRKLIVSHPVALVRIIAQHPPHWLAHIIETLTAKNQQRLPRYMEELVEIHATLHPGNDRRTVRESRNEYWKQVMLTAAKKENMSTEALMADSILSSKDNRELTVWLDCAAKTGQQPLVLPLLRQLTATKDRVVSLPVGNTQSETSPGKQKASVTEEGLYISCAGLVILHPLLQRCFSYAGYWNGTGFASSEAQHKAILLLYWMCAGEQSPREHELVIHKILSGLPIQEVPDTCIELSDQDKIIAGDLLDAVISSWSILKNTSRDGLRQQFLQRPGKLIAKDNDWKLLVESNTVDLLLDHLPWSLSRIKLPWMTQWLKVEWR